MENQYPVKRGPLFDPLKIDTGANEAERSVSRIMLTRPVPTS